jgi:hypothetical protein
MLKNIERGPCSVEWDISLTTKEEEQGSSPGDRERALQHGMGGESQTPAMWRSRGKKPINCTKHDSQ